MKKMVEQDSTIQINLNESIGKIDPFVLGQFIEHFPHQIYGRIYEERCSHSDSKGYRSSNLTINKKRINNK